MFAIVIYTNGTDKFAFGEEDETDMYRIA